MTERLRLTYLEIDEIFDGVPVFTVGYPDPISLEDDACGDATLTEGERRFVQEFVDKLNQMIEQTSQEFGFRYVDGVRTALSVRHLQLCDERNAGRAGLNFVNLRSVRGEALQRFNPANWYHNTLHPNEDGHRALWQAFADTLSALEPISSMDPRAKVDDAARKRLRLQLDDWQGLQKNSARNASMSKDQLEAAPQCELSADSPETACSTQAIDWALEQVRLFLERAASCCC